LSDKTALEVSSGSRRRSGWRKVTLYGLLPYFALVVLRLLLAAPLEAPMVLDELGYLGNARYMATGAGQVEAAGRAAYKLGYSVFLAPLFTVAETPEEGYRLTLVLNAFLLSTAYLALFTFLGQILPAVAPGRRALAAFTLNLHPAILIYSLSAMSANLFIPLFCAFTVALFAALKTGGLWRWSGVGLAAGLLYATHERALGVLLLTAGLAIAHPLWERRRRSLTSLAALGVAAGVWGGFGLVILPGTVYQQGKAKATLIKALQDPLTILVEVCGQGLYLSLSTLGLVTVGAALVVVCLARKRWPLAGSGAFWLTWAASAASVFAISVLFMAPLGIDNLTYLIYGRYNEGILLPVLAVFLALAHEVGPARARDAPAIPWRLIGTTLGVAVCMVLVTFWVLVRFRGDLLAGHPYYFNVLGAFPWIKIGLHPWVSPVVAAVLIPLLGLWATGLLARWRPAVVLLLVLFTAGSWQTYSKFFIGFAAAKAKQHGLADVVGGLEQSPPSIGYDPSVFPNFHYYNYSYHLPGIDLPRLSPDRLDASSPDLYISPVRDLAATVPGARLVAMEHLPPLFGSYVQYLWVRPGKLQDQLGARGWLFPAEFPDTVLCPAPYSRLQVLAPSPANGAWPNGEPVSLRIQNRGRCPWPDATGLRSERGAVRVGLIWRRAEDPRGPAVVERRVDLPRTIMPGDTVDVRVPIHAPASRAEWIVEIRLVQEGVFWFGEEQNPGLTLRVSG